MCVWAHTHVLELRKSALKYSPFYKAQKKLFLYHPYSSLTQSQDSQSLMVPGQRLRPNRSKCGRSPGSHFYHIHSWFASLTHRKHALSQCLLNCANLIHIPASPRPKRSLCISGLGNSRQRASVLAWDNGNDGGGI